MRKKKLSLTSFLGISDVVKGIDSPTNIALISNVAELVTRSFSKNTNQQNQQNTWDRRQMTDRPTEHLEDFDELPQNQPNSFPSNSNEEHIDDNVIIGSTAGATNVDHGFLGKVLGILGMDTKKIGALAINGIIFIAQMVLCFFICLIFEKKSKNILKTAKIFLKN